MTFTVPAGGAADFFGRLLYASLQGRNVDNALRVEFALPNGAPTRLQKIWAGFQYRCALSGELCNVCQMTRKYWHPHNPANIP